MNPFLCLLLPLLLSASTPPDNAAKSRLVKKQLTGLFEACRASDYQRATKYIVYRGPEARREWADSYDFSKEQERGVVQRMCERIDAYLALDSTPEFERFTIRKQGKQEWGAWQLRFQGESRQERLLFAFVKVKGKYLLGDIDREQVSE